MARSFTAKIHQEDDGTFWAQVEELPGCFASGDSLDELTEALGEAIGMMLEERIVGLELSRQPPPPANGKRRALRVGKLTLIDI